MQTTSTTPLRETFATATEGELLQGVEQRRRAVSAQTDEQFRSSLGQFMTPATVAAFMASMFTVRKQSIRLLDPGAGVGALTAAFVTDQLGRRKPPKQIAVTAYEIDAELLPHLLKTLDHCERTCRDKGIRFGFDLRREDFIGASVGQRSLFGDPKGCYDCVIMNPPYRKIRSDSPTRRMLSAAGIETSNLYTAFMLLAARQLSESGELVSITPRSFCNGPYFRPFREEFLRLMSLSEVHVFESRDHLFREDDVLQENVILHARRASAAPAVVVLSSTAADGLQSRREVEFSQVVRPSDPERVLHLSLDGKADEVTEQMLGLPCSLPDLGLSVSTGRVVDFRAREYLREQPSDGTVPLIYPAHFHHGFVVWPNGNTRKPNAICRTDRVRDQLVPAGYYVLVKRFSAKEEKRRVVAVIYDPTKIMADLVGFENHLNYFHRGGDGMAREVALGLAVFLNSTVVDQYFRVFSGHTQVNAADLKRLPYPTEADLVGLGMHCRDVADQDRVDAAMAKVLGSGG